MGSNGPITHVPHDAWYAVAHCEDVGRAPVGRRVHNSGIVLYRKLDGSIVALADRCVHRPYPLSRGVVDGDSITSTFSGFKYGPDGRVLAVPTQDAVPVGAAVRAYPAQETAGLVWVWTGNPGLATHRPLPQMPWLSEPGWATFGADWETAASLGMLQDNLADITHVAFLDPELSPPALLQPPHLNVEVSERQVRFWRDFPASPLQTWQVEVLGLPADEGFEQREEGLMAAPGVWLDRWDVKTADGGVRTMHFAHAITPVSERKTHHFWAVSRNFALDAGTTGTLRQMLERYYRTVAEALEVMQDVIDREGPAREFMVRTDGAVLEARRVMRRLLEEESAR